MARIRSASRGTPTLALATCRSMRSNSAVTEAAMQPSSTCGTSTAEDAERDPAGSIVLWRGFSGHHQRNPDLQDLYSWAAALWKASALVQMWAEHFLEGEFYSLVL